MEKFLKTVTYHKMTPEASREVGEVTEGQCKIERILAHAITAPASGSVRDEGEKHNNPDWSISFGERRNDAKEPQGTKLNRIVSLR